MEVRRRVLLTGASGFLGQVILETMRGSIDFTTVGRSMGSDITVDLSKEMPSIDRAHDLVVHVAGKAHSIPKTKQDVREFFEVNVKGTKNLLMGLDRLPELPDRFVFVSSVAVYGREEGELIDEEYPLHGKTPYASSKIQTEEMLTQWCGKNNVRLAILRLPLVVGVSPPGNLGAMLKTAKRGLYIGIGSGKVRRSMVLAEDVASAILEKEIIGIYNLTDGYHPTMRELEAVIFGQIKRKMPLRVSNQMLQFVAMTGDVLGSWFPLNTYRFKKLTSSLTFSDLKARSAWGWNPRSVIHHFPLMQE